MLDVPLEAAAELLPTLLYAILAGVLGFLGVSAELTGLRTAATGDMVAAAWLAAMGLVALYAASRLLSDRIIPALRDTA